MDFYRSRNEREIKNFFSFNFLPPFGVAQINNCDTQGKVTQKANVKKLGTHNISIGLPLWQRLKKIE
jgi:hypothetical protein